MPFKQLVLILWVSGFVTVAHAAGPDPVDCREDYACFQQAARDCRPARLNASERLDAGSVSRQTFWFRHEVLGPAEGKCLITVQLSGMDVRYTDHFLTDMAVRGVSPGQLHDMQLRLRHAQSQMDPIFESLGLRWYRIDPRYYDTSVLRIMNRSLLTKLPPHSAE